ncbi:MAG: CoB--CoM heterodisulfide reductase iron-sulfur subunit B family protein [Candidatus Bathyarchaeota archaeon]|nr:CoB--CoM heterodisulfide reductase iron-sulfur subunit B family protein [Candidatus Bathyarchaeota archaeon]
MTSLEYALFPGCVASVREFGYELAIRNVFKALDIKLRKVEDFSCCQPACLVHSIDYVKGLALTSRNLAVAEETGLPMLTLCSSCYGNLSRAKHLLDHNSDLKDEVNDLLAKAGRTYRGDVKIEHVVTVLHDESMLPILEKKISNPLSKLKAAPFYGCHIFMPAKYSKFDDPEFPHKLDDLIEITGAESLDYNEKTSCCIGCGSFFGEVSEEASVLLSEMIIGSAKEKGADCIVTTCPFCIMQLEIGQIKLREQGKDFGVPVIHYVDLLGLSMGFKPDELGFDLRRINMEPVVSRL